MAFKIDDSVLWLGFGAFLFVAGKAIHYALTDIIRLAEIDPHQYEPERKLDQSEDAIEIDTLRKLISSPDYSISTAATSVVVSRASDNTAVQKLIFAECESDDPEIRSQAMTAVRYMQTCAMSGRGFVFNPAAMPPPSLRHRENSHGAPDAPVDGDSGSRRSTESGHDDAHLAVPPLQAVEVEIEPDARLPQPPERQRLILFNRERLREAADAPAMVNPIAGWIDIPRAQSPVRHNETEQEARQRRREAMALIVDDGSERPDEA